VAKLQTLTNDNRKCTQLLI